MRLHLMVLLTALAVIGESGPAEPANAPRLECELTVKNPRLAFMELPEFTVTLRNNLEESADVVGYDRHSARREARLPLPCIQVKVTAEDGHYSVHSCGPAACKPEVLRLDPGEAVSFDWPPPRKGEIAYKPEKPMSFLLAYLPGQYSVRATYFVRESEIEQFGKDLAYGETMGPLSGQPAERLWRGIVCSNSATFEVLEDGSEQLRLRRTIDAGVGIRENLVFELRANKTTLSEGEYVYLSLSAKNVGTETIHFGNKHLLLAENGPRGKRRRDLAGPMSVYRKIQPGETASLIGWSFGSGDPLIAGTYKVWAECEMHREPYEVLARSNTVTLVVEKPLDHH